MDPVVQNSKRILLSNWGNFPVKQCNVYRPEKIESIKDTYIEHTRSLISRGTGKSYGDCSLNPEGVISSERINKFIDFDTEKGLVTCQAGVRLAEILEVAVLKGWFLPVIPGTKFASIGGCIASNVHGKNHYNSGDLAEHVKKIRLRVADGRTINCSASENQEIFWATAGGMGMTGFIEQVTLKLKPIESISMVTQAQRVANIEEMVELFRNARNESEYEYMVGWIDHFGKGKDLGRGVFEKARHAKLQEGEILSSFRIKEAMISIPSFFPNFLLNRYSMQFYNKLKFFGVSRKPKTKLKNFSGFFHPLDEMDNWNRLYGKKGFLQYQFMVPEGEYCLENLRKILAMIQESGLFSYLAVIKYHRNSKGFMSFPIEGFSVALDFNVNDKIFALLDKVDEYLCKIGGRIYLAKDARLKKEHFKIMYRTNLPKWKNIIRAMDPGFKINSEMSNRLGFKE